MLVRGPGSAKNTQSVMLPCAQEELQDTTTERSTHSVRIKIGKSSSEGAHTLTTSATVQAEMEYESVVGAVVCLKVRCMQQETAGEDMKRCTREKQRMSADDCRRGRGTPHTRGGGPEERRYDVQASMQANSQTRWRTGAYASGAEVVGS